MTSEGVVWASSMATATTAAVREQATEGGIARVDKEEEEEVTGGRAEGGESGKGLWLVAF
jgi:hypothetical protein